MIFRRLFAATFAAALAGCSMAGPGAEGPQGPQPGEGPAEQPDPTDRRDALVIGVLVPRTGSPYLKQYGDLVLEGIELADAAYAAGGRRPVDVRIRDTSGTATGAADGARALEGEGAIAIVGPLLPESVDAAVRARTSATPLISPTTPDAPTGHANAYSLNAEDTQGAVAIARWAAAQRGLRIGILHPNNPAARRQVAAFTDALVAAGGRVTLAVPYDAGTTTFAAQFERLSNANITALFIPADERDIRQIAPQVEYYGLRDVQVLGGEAWVSDEVLKNVAARNLEGVVAAMPLFRSDDAVAWEDLVAAYERANRRSLDHPFPALGYDALNIVLSAVEAGADSPADVARYLSSLRAYRGASGVISIRDGTVVRAPFLVRIQNGRAVKLEGPVTP